MLYPDDRSFPLRAALHLLALLLGFCCSLPTLGAPVSVTPETTYSLRFTGIWIPFDGKISSRLKKADIDGDIVNALKKYGYKIEDAKSDSRFKLSAMAKELNCVGRGEMSCEIEIMWELSDARVSDVVYRVRTRATELHFREEDQIDGLKRLVLKALDSLLSRPRFAERLQRNASAADDEESRQSGFEDAAFRRCDAAPLKMPGDAASALAATTLIRSGRSVGSGVSISPDGFILTAAHVVDRGAITVVFQDGKEYEAVPVRRNPKRDVALLKLKGTGFPCLNAGKRRGKIGEKIYVVGAPAGEDLAFSMTTGIISAERNWDEDTYLQTDASVNPGNSGGPMLDEEGNVLATVSWKLVGVGVEGIGFGIPVDVAFKALAVTPGDASAAALSREPETAHGPKALSANEIEDTPDEKQNLLPKGEPDAMKTSNWKKPLKNAFRWSGVGLFTVGSILTTVSYLQVKIASGKESDDWDLMTYSQYKSWTTVNIVGWVTAPLGAALFITSFLIRSDDKWSKEARVRGGFSGSAATLEVRF